MELVDRMWLECRSDYLLIMSSGQLFFFNPDHKICRKPLVNVKDCTEFVLFEAANEELHLAVLAEKSVLIIQVQPNESFVTKQILSLDEAPISIAASSSSLLLQYTKDIERLMLDNQHLQVNKIRVSTATHIAYIHELQAFLLCAENVTYFIPQSGPFDVNAFKIRWHITPRRLVVVDPYLVAVGSERIEARNYYKPYGAVQMLDDVWTSAVAGSSEYVGVAREVGDELPGLFMVMQGVGKAALGKLEQTKLEVQCKWFIEMKMYRLGLNICDAFIRRKYKKAVTENEYIGIQRERGYHLFVVDKNYKKAKKVFEKYGTPPEEVILLFAELLHKADVEKLVKLFSIGANSSVYHYCTYSVEDGTVPANRMKELVSQLKIFLLFFMDKRKELAEKAASSKEEVEKWTFLKMLYEMVFFHGCLILIICKDPDASLVILEFNAMISEENSLPSAVCEDLLVKYGVFSLLFQFLISKKLFKRAAGYLKDFCQELPKPESNFVGSIKQYWLNETVKTAQTISCSMEETDFLKSFQWLIESDNIPTFLECLKLPPKHALYSPALLAFLIEKAGLRAGIAHLEYLVFESANPPYGIDTLLGSYYIGAIEERTRAMSNVKNNPELTLEEINNDVEVVMIRGRFGRFLETVPAYDVDEIYKNVPPYLLKERGILLVRQAKFVEGFSELILEAQLPLLAIRIGEEYYNRTKDKNVLLALVKSLFDSYKVGNCLILATAVLEKYFDVLAETDVLGIIPEEVEGEKVLAPLVRILEKEISTKNMLEVCKSCEEYRLLELKVTENKLKGVYKRMEGNEVCEKCGDPIGEADALFIGINGSVRHYRCGN
eukprot:TRINITY_DN3931_c0_g1_i16.p1 TRINITY_DN3931_c0_g1~~TRINITY_DN3931_c0_g1_i16.p1  ORF type:complete len:835 (-),score=239.29 TRINITY_DN3931_c0_g1_i16:148-2652(-)